MQETAVYPVLRTERARAYAAPFAVLIVLLAIGPHLPGPLGAYSYVVRTVAAAAAILLLSRDAIGPRPQRWGASAALGVAVFALWVGPDLLWDGYRNHWVFTNRLVGGAPSAVAANLKTDPLFLLFRVTGSALVVPVAEELFWRGFLMRWVIRRDFWTVPLGTYSHLAFWLTAILFASEHGAFWGVGLLAGIAYNWWLLRTRNLADCILAHAVTNALLAAYVLGADRWDYWL